MEKKVFLIIVGCMAVAAAVAVAIAVPLTVGKGSKNLQDANKILEEVPLIDGHNDMTYQLRRHFNNRLEDVNLNSDLTKAFNGSHTDIPRIREGKLSAQFWACYTSCDTKQKDAVRRALEQIDVMKRFIDQYPDTFQAAYTAADIENAFQDGKVASLVGVEGGHMIDSSLAALRMLYNLGARYMTLTHSCDNPWADTAGSNTHGGLTDFGKKVIREMNRLGMLIDLSHVSDAVMRQVIDMTAAPVIFSHSSVRKLCDHVRNVPDDVLLSMKENDGIVMINFYNDYVTCQKNATLEDVADHYDYMKNLTGTARYLGVGADYDGVTRVPTGLEDVSKYPYLFAELLRRGWTPDELKDVAGRNLLRVFKKTEEVAASLASTKPGEDWIPEADVAGAQCRSLN